MDITVLFEDDDLLVINKPYGVVVNRADTVRESTIQDWVESRYKIFDLGLKHKENEDFYNRNGIVHRLDKETSGCLIIAKTPVNFALLQAEFKNRQVKKEYIALVHGILKPKTGDINVPIGRVHGNHEKFGVVPDGKAAYTRYEVENFYRRISENFSLVNVFPETGRTHQIRVHLKYLGFPIVGDYLYAGKKTQERDRHWCPRVFLHARKISFLHPKTHKQITVAAPMPQELAEIIKTFTKID